MGLVFMGPPSQAFSHHFPYDSDRNKVVFPPYSFHPFQGGFGRCSCAGQTSELISKIESDKGRSFRWHWMQITLFRCLVPISYHRSRGYRVIYNIYNPSYGKWLGKPKTLDLMCQPRYVGDRLYNCSDLKGIVMKSAEQ